VKSAIFRPTLACAQYARYRLCSSFLLGAIGCVVIIALMSQSAICAETVTLNPGEDNPTLPVYISGIAFFDTNQNGQLDNLEWAISGATIELYKNGDMTTPYKTTTVNSYGQYSFNSITPGTYALRNTMNGNWLPVLGKILDVSDKYKTTGLGTVNASKTEIDDVVLSPGDQATFYNFAAQDYPIQLLSKRMLLASTPDHPHAVPEPSTMLMLCVAVVFTGIGAARRRFTK
jgi:hypothetical protein